MNIDFARRQMIDQQVRAWTVLDPEVLDVLAVTPRERFVPESYRSLAFADMEIPLDHGEVMMTPTVEGRVLQALAIEPGHRVLEIGTGSGFLTACLATLASSVTSIDIHDDFVRDAARKLTASGIDNVVLETMDAMHELPDGRFDAIAVTGSIATFDTRFVDALEPGGRMFVVVGSPPVMDARLVHRSGDGAWLSESLFETNLAALVHAAPLAQFSF